MSAISELYRFDPQLGQITKPRWSPDGRLLALPTRSGTIGIFDIDDRRLFGTIGSHSGEVTAVTWDRKSEFIMTGSLDGSIGLWEVETGRRAPVNITGHKEPVHSIEWTDEEAFAMTCSADRVRAFDGCCLLTGWTDEMENTANRYTGLTSATCSSQTTFLLAMSAEDGARLILASLLSGAVLDSIEMPEIINCLAWSPVEELLAVGAGSSIVLCRAAQTGFEGTPRVISRHGEMTYAVSLSSDGTLLASQDSESLKIWNIGNGSLISTFQENTETAFAACSRPGIAFHPTKAVLATVTAGGNAFRIFGVNKNAT